ncbi:ATP-binding protein [Sphingomonas sabuli]|uniref:ATP-binding protein n=1 Tax=Sphingomonas sabuli TaxID=2764186 RepID=A0A7G9L3W6_9SPHN|nr:ATP-binding protein [Sphingomonas sabuli]QNM83315.1 ATP-binding protein [Sphingomonas sabuli]
MTPLNTSLSQGETKANAPIVQEPPSSSMIVVGKDVLELLSSAMYVDPLSIYREYVQNAADAIDEARDVGELKPDDPGRVDIRIDPDRRSIIIRDNGLGLPVSSAARCLLAIGASAKRGTRARGFRGIGRLAGLAYARSLTFRTRAAGDDQVVEIRWDCQRLKAALRDVEEQDDVASVIQRVVTISRLPGEAWPSHFFEVELNDVIRTRRDDLLSPGLVRDYLEQVAPVPFDETFSWGSKIDGRLASVRLGNLQVLINDDLQPVTRPFRDRFRVSTTLEDSLTEFEAIELSDLDGGVAAVGWIMHHQYLGSITIKSRVGGLRIRVGNVQVGDHEILSEVFPEPRFNGWTVGEIHILDPRILPNARRDNFEQNIHYSNFTAQLEPIGKRIAKRARSASVIRNLDRKASSATAAPTMMPSEGAPSLATSESESGDGIAGKADEAQLDALQVTFLEAVRELAEKGALTAEEARAALRHF